MQQLAKEGVIPASTTRGQYDIIPSVVAYIRHLRAVASGDGGDLLTEKTRLARAQAEKPKSRSLASRACWCPLRKSSAPGPR